MKLSLKAFTITCGLLWAGSVLLIGLCNLASPTYGVAFLQLCSSIYPGYHADPTLGSVLVGTGYALVDGAVGGAIFAWLYNLCAK